MHFLRFMNNNTAPIKSLVASLSESAGDLLFTNNILEILICSSFLSLPKCLLSAVDTLIYGY